MAEEEQLAPGGLVEVVMAELPHRQELPEPQIRVAAEVEVVEAPLLAVLVAQASLPYVISSHTRIT